TYALVDHALFRAFNKGAVGQLVVEGMGNKDVFGERIGERRYTHGAAIAAAPEPKLDTAQLAGKASYEKVCLACHQANGQGVPNVFPPLAQSDYMAKASKDQLVGHVLNGLQGPITVNGESYNGVM